MYKISTTTDKPDIGFMLITIEKLMQKGIRVAKCKDIKDQYCNLRTKLKQDIKDRYGIENANSYQQIARYMEETSAKVSLNSVNDIINICYDEKAGKWVSKAKNLQKLAYLGYDFAQDLMDYRHVKKYAESLESILLAADSNNLIHPQVSLGKTNRINYSNPGLLTIPKQLLWHIIAPYTEGNVLYSVDIKNQEPSILINITNAKELKEHLKSEEGIYTAMFKKCFIPFTTANIVVDALPENRIYNINELRQIGTISPAKYCSEKPLIKDVYFNEKRVVYIQNICIGSSKGIVPSLPKTVSIETEDGKAYEIEVEWESYEKKYKKGNDYSLRGELKGLDIKVGKAEKQEFKTAWLAISYGASILSIDENCKTINGKHVYRYITKVNELKEYRQRVDKLARAGYNVVNTLFGTRVSAGSTDSYYQLKRVLLDLPIQGTGADILSLLIQRVLEYTKEHNTADKICIYYTRHDEIIFEVDKDWLADKGEQYVEQFIRDMVEHQIDDWEPFKLEIAQVKAAKLEVYEDEEEY